MIKKIIILIIKYNLCTECVSVFDGEEASAEKHESRVGEGMNVHNTMGVLNWFHKANEQFLCIFHVDKQMRIRNKCTVFYRVSFEFSIRKKKKNHLTIRDKLLE